jgi:hypothetical protein
MVIKCVGTCQAYSVYQEFSLVAASRFFRAEVNVPENTLRRQEVIISQPTYTNINHEAQELIPSPSINELTDNNFVLVNGYYYLRQNVAPIRLYSDIDSETFLKWLTGTMSDYDFDEYVFRHALRRILNKISPFALESLLSNNEINSLLQGVVRRENFRRKLNALRAIVQLYPQTNTNNALTHINFNYPNNESLSATHHYAQLEFNTIYLPVQTVRQYFSRITGLSHEIASTINLNNFERNYPADYSLPGLYQGLDDETLACIIQSLFADDPEKRKQLVEENNQIINDLSQVNNQMRPNNNFPINPIYISSDDEEVIPIGGRNNIQPDSTRRRRRAQKRNLNPKKKKPADSMFVDESDQEDQPRRRRRTNKNSKKKSKGKFILISMNNFDNMKKPPKGKI